METMEKKPLFEPQKQSNALFTVIFKSGQPFKSGVNEKFNKPWHGYDVSCNGVEYTWFASEAAHLLISQSGVKDGDECTIEYKSGTNNTGNNYNIWLLNGKSAKDYAQENAADPGSPIEAPSPEPTTVPVTATAEATPSSGKSDSEKLAILWGAFIKANPDEDIPF